MGAHKFAVCLIFVAAVFCISLPPAKAASDAESARTQRLADLKKSDPTDVSLAVMPMKFGSQLPMANTGILTDLLGLVLESSGMNNLEALYTEFSLPADTAWEQIPSQLAEFLKKNPTKNKYVLFSQCLGNWPSGPPSEIRFVVTDAAGNLVLADSQTSKDEDFKRMVSADPDPMGFSALVAQRLFVLLGWKPSDRETHGKFARKWAQMSGMPSDEEMASMEKSFDTIKGTAKTIQIAVYSTFVNQRPNTQSAANLASLINQKIGCKTTKIDKEIPFQRQPTGNEQKLLWDLARTFRDYLRSNPPNADYALLAEYFVSPDGSQANAVHFVICEKSGSWVLADFQNSTHEDFRKIAPKSVEDCDRLAVQRLADRLGTREATATNAADNPFIGTWKLNLQKSRFTINPAPKSSAITYSAVDNGMIFAQENVDSTGRVNQLRAMERFDGKEGESVFPGATAIHTRVDINTVLIVVRRDGKEVLRITENVSKDGKTLTRISKVKNEEGIDREQVAVFEKEQ